MYDVVALGELLIDFVRDDKISSGFEFVGNPGGAPANVVTALAKMGRKTSFIGKVGNDQFGVFLDNTLNNYNVDTNGLVISTDVNTTLAFVHLNEHGDRSFTFYRNPGADATLSEDEIQFELIKKAKIFHFGSLSMTNEVIRQATMKAVEYARRHGSLISYDPNLRLALWEEPTLAKRVISSAIPYVDIMKISEEELEFLTGEADLEIGTQRIYDDNHLKLILVTLGEKGCYYRYGHQSGYVPAISVQTVDTTGAGDAFVAGFLHKVIDWRDELLSLSSSNLEEMIRFANVVAALSTTKKGGIPSMPSLDEINQRYPSLG